MSDTNAAFLALSVGPRTAEDVFRSLVLNPEWNAIITSQSGAVQAEGEQEEFAIYRPRFSAECSDLGITAESGADKALSVRVDVARLEAVEHVPSLKTPPAVSRALEQVSSCLVKWTRCVSHSWC